MTATYIEITKADHKQGGPGWSLGECLWSPSRNRAGSDSYRLMREPRIGDEVIHICRDSPHGVLNTFVIGSSRVAASCEEIATEPPGAGVWAARPPYYRIALSDYQQYQAPLSVPALLVEYSDEIRTELIVTKPRYYPFVTHGHLIRTVQGIYLARCTLSLRHLLTQALSIVDAVRRTNDEEPKHAYLESRRLAHERYFFARNPALSQAAKRRRGYICETCGFNFRATYGELGKDFIEAHHLDPLSERLEYDWTDELITSVDRVAVLCSNCHRMIHRRRPALTLEELRTAITTTTA